MQYAAVGSGGKTGIQSGSSLISFSCIQAKGCTVHSHIVIVFELIHLDGVFGRLVIDGNVSLAHVD